MSILPQKIDFLKKDNNETETFKEYAVDLKTGKLIYENGKNKIVEGKEALKIWIWKVLQTSKGKYEAYSNNYGNEFENIIGKNYSKALTESELRRLTEECLVKNKFIKGISNFCATIEGSKVTINVAVKTVYGEVNVDV